MILVKNTHTTNVLKVKRLKVQLNQAEGALELVKNSLAANVLHVKRLKVQLKEANDALAALGQEKELTGDSEWVSVRSVV